MATDAQMARIQSFAFDGSSVCIADSPVVTGD